MNSERLRRYVIEELTFDPCVDASGIGVAVENRIVSLAGHVHSAAGRMAVVDAVKRLKGVRGIVVDIDVRPTAESKMDDGEIARGAAALLAWHRSVPRDSIAVAVDGGYVRLSGTVDWQYQRLAVEEDMRRLVGVTGIDNGIAIRDASPECDIRESIKEAMYRLADVHPSQINVHADEEGHVKLKGRVVGLQARKAVEDAAWRVAGVRDVDNQLRIG